MCTTQNQIVFAAPHTCGALVKDVLGLASTDHVHTAGSGSTLPASSTAAMANM